MYPGTIPRPTPVNRTCNFSLIPSTLHNPLAQRERNVNVNPCPRLGRWQTATPRASVRPLPLPPQPTSRRQRIRSLGNPTPGTVLQQATRGARQLQIKTRIEKRSADPQGRGGRVGKRRRVPVERGRRAGNRLVSAQRLLAKRRVADEVCDQRRGAAEDPLRPGRTEPERERTITAGLLKPQGLPSGKIAAFHIFMSSCWKISHPESFNCVRPEPMLFSVVDRSTLVLC